MTILLWVLPLVLVILALVDIITREEWQVKHLPKFVWIFLVILLPLIGSIVWFAVGREYSGTTASPVTRSTSTPASRPRTIEEELAAIDAEIAFHENQARIRRLEAELEARRKAGGETT